jgi:glutaredoxin-related protein
MSIADAAAAPRATCPDASLQREIESAPIVVFASNLTDLRQLESYLARRGGRYRVVRMGMAAADMRERFHALERYTDWHELPQVFVDGRFVGGHDELLALDRAATGADAPIPPAALALGVAGLIPFAAGALGLWLAPAALAADILSLLVLYAALILAFVGAVHWGAALHAGRGDPATLWARLIVSVAPALLAWASFGFSARTALGLILLGFVAVYVVDQVAERRGELPRWYLKLRTGLTAGAVGCLGASVIALTLAG